MAGEAAVFRRLLDAFEKENPGLRVRDESLPSSTDEQHQFYVLNLEGGSSDFDVLSLDVIWVPEFARAGWLRDLTGLLPPGDTDDFFPGPRQAVTFEGHVYAIPWFVDVGLLFYRRDLLAKYGVPVPRRWPELVEACIRIGSHEPSLYGFLWQGKQYEGLVCNILEYLKANGGAVLEGDQPVLDSSPNRQALTFVRDLISRYRVSPPIVLNMEEETARRIFGSGAAIFMRNWPYAWQVLQREGSPVKGKIGVAELPAFPGHRPAPALGGWQIGVNRNSRNPEGAEKLALFLTSRGAQKEIALRMGYQPARRSLYRDPDFKRALPFMAGLESVLMDARPRPVTSYYMMITQVLQSEFSAAISGIRPVGEALESANRQIAHIMEAD